MNPRLVEYYNQELAYLRELGTEFAAAFPKVAGRLSLRDTEVADPYVERLLEGFSFLTARIRMKMDAEFPRLSQRVLEMVCPHYLAPTPAMVVVCMEPGGHEGRLAQGYRLPAGSLIRSRRASEEQLACDFRTGHELMLWPVELRAARLGGPPLALPVARLNLAQEAAGHLRLDLLSTDGVGWRQIGLDRLDFFINASDALASHLQELLHGSLLGIVVHDAHDPSQVWSQLPPSALRAQGYEPEQALLPYSHRAFQGHRLLHEYFAFPARFRFFSIDGLAPALARAPGRELALTLLLSRSEPNLEPQVDAQRFMLHCVPAVNLFERPADRIHLATQVHEYHVVPDRARPRDFEVYSVTRVSGHDEGQTHERAFLPLYTAVHGLRSDEQAYFTLRREPRLFSEQATRFGPRSQYLGSEVFISLVDQREAPFSEGLKQLSLRALCTNRDLPLLMGVNQAGGDFNTLESAPVARIRTVAGPSQPVASVAENEITWRLISHLSLNYLALSDRLDEEGAATLRDLLGLYLALGDPGLAGQVAGINSVALTPITRRLLQFPQMLYGRGVGVEVQVDEAPFAGVSPWPLMAVVERFLARHVGVNSFTELSLLSRQRGPIGRWQVRPGQRPGT